MDTGRILIGIAFVMFSVALMVTPSSAAGWDISCEVGNGSAVSSAENMIDFQVLQVQDGTALSSIFAGTKTEQKSTP